ncbi:MAG: SUMF1/EgtB/PvdO family nonheme iron enzyme [Thermodesulfobacteriota bacterium]
MPSLVTLNGIDQAIAALNLKPGTLKAMLAEAIRSCLPDDETLPTVTSISTDELVAKVYGVSKAGDIKAKKKNFSSLKSGLNKSLRDLDADQNPEGIIIGRDNVFVVSDERKDNLIRELGLAAESTQTLREMFKSFKNLFNEVIKEKGVHEVKDLLQEFDEARKLIEGLDGLATGTPPPAPPAEPAAEPQEQVAAPEEGEVVEADEVELVEEVPPAKVGEIPAGELEEVAPEEIEEVSEEELEEVEELPPLPSEEVGESGEDVEVVEADEVEEVAAGELEEVAELPAEEALEEVAPEEIEEVGEEELEEVEELPPLPSEEVGESGEDVEVVEADEVEEVAAGELEEVAELPAEEALEEVAPEEIEEVGEEELEEVEELPPLPSEEVGESGEDVEVVEADEVEEVAAGELEEVAELPAEEAPEEVAPEEIEEVGEEELEEVEELPPLPSEEVGESGEDVEVVEADEVEEVAAGELEEIAELPTEEALEEVAPEEIEEVGEEELEEVEELPPEEVKKPGSPLDILSKYLEADEAVAEEGDYLKESDEEYAAQILGRFMPKFVHIPEGDYLVGSAQPKGLERPQHRVALPSFYLGQFPVTNDLFDLFVRETGYETDAEAAGYGIVFEGRCVTTIDPLTNRATVTLSAGTSAHHVSGACWRHPHGPESTIEGKHHHPVVQVSHKDAMAFAAWAGKRLPTEEEWEAAARGPNGHLYPWGNNWLPKLANLESSCQGDTMPVDRHGREAMSHFGIHDLLGNVYEWTATVHQRPGAAGASGSKIIYVLKGGCWTSRGVITTCHREIERGHYWANTIGFRCAV